MTDKEKLDQLELAAALALRDINASPPRLGAARRKLREALDTGQIHSGKKRPDNTGGGNTFDYKSRAKKHCTWQKLAQDQSILADCHKPATHGQYCEQHYRMEHHHQDGRGQ